MNRSARLALLVGAAARGTGVGIARGHVGAHVVHARPRHDLGRSKAQAVPAAQIVVEIQAGQEVGVALLNRNRTDRDRGDRSVDPQARRGLLLVDHLKPDVAVQIAGIDRRLGTEGQDVFLDLPRLVVVVGIQQRGLGVAAEHRGQIPGQHIAEADEVERGRRNDRTRGNRDLRAAVLEIEIDLVDGLALVAMGIVHAQLDLGNEAFTHVVGQTEIGGGDLFLDVRRLHQAIVAPAAPRRTIAQRNLAGIGVVEAPVAVGGEAFERDREVILIHRPGLEGADAVSRVGLDVGFIAGVARIAQIDRRGQAIAELGVGVPPGREQFVVAGVEIVAQDRRSILEMPRRAQDRSAQPGHRLIAEGGVVGPGVREPLRAAADRLLLEARIVEVKHRVEAVAGLEFQRTHHPVALVLAVDRPGFLPVELKRGSNVRGADHQRIAEVEGLVAIGLVVIDMARRIEVRVADRPAERTGLVLIDIAEAAAPALVRHVVIAPAAFVDLAADVQRDRALAIGDRAHGAQIDRPGQAHAGNVGIGGLVDHRGRKQFRGILIEFDRAVIARAGLLAPIEQHGGEIGSKAADRDDLRTAGNALRGKAGQTGDRFGDRHVGQLTDVFGRNRLDDAGFVLLGVDRVGQRIAQPRNHDGRIVAGIVGFLRESCLRHHADKRQRRNRGCAESVSPRQALLRRAGMHPHTHQKPSVIRGFPANLPDKDMPRPRIPNWKRFQSMPKNAQPVKRANNKSCH